MQGSALIRNDADFLELLGRNAATREISLDCEFHGEKRYRPTLYLVQIGFGDEVAAVDPQAVDLRPLRSLLDDGNVRKVLHAGREDVRLLSRATGALGFPFVFDTQVAAAFVGYGTSIGYAKLVKDVLGVELDKTSQFTDWSGKLTDEQIDYALNDVRFLPEVTMSLLARLELRGRIEWALEASQAMVRAALAEPDPRKLYRKVSGFASLSPVQLGALRELAMWRDKIAESENCRPESVISDPALRQIALRPPTKPGHMRGLRGVGIGGAERWWVGLREAVARGTAEPEPAFAIVEPDPRTEAIAALLTVIRRVVAGENDVAPDLLAQTADLRALAEWHVSRKTPPPALEVLAGWRESLIGKPLLRALAGELAIKVAEDAPSGVTLVSTR